MQTTVPLQSCPVRLPAIRSARGWTTLSGGRQLGWWRWTCDGEYIRKCRGGNGECRGPETAEITFPFSLSLPLLSSFNGAAVRRPRRAPSGSATPRNSPRFNGAAVRRPRRVDVKSMAKLTVEQLQRGRGPETAESTPVMIEGVSHIGSFNGAAVRRPRRGGDLRGNVANYEVLQRGRGPETAERSQPTAPRPFTTCFNGAAVRRPRREMNATQNRIAVTGLQRGRGPETAESPGSARFAEMLGECFNGAAVRRPRRAPRRRRRTRAKGKLQRGRGPETAESTSSPSASRTKRQALQRGRGPETAERTERIRRWNRGTNASTGPRSGDRGESMSAKQVQAVMPKLQRGRGPETAESTTHACYYNLVIGASTGPRSGDRGERSQPGCGDDAHAGFNGAAVRRPRRVRALP